MATKKSTPAKKSSPAKKAAAKKAAPAGRGAAQKAGRSSPPASTERSAAQAAAAANQAARAAEDVAESIQKVLASLEERLRGLSDSRSSPARRRGFTTHGMQAVTGCSVVGGEVQFALADGSKVWLDDVLNRSMLVGMGFDSLSAQQRATLKSQLVPLFEFLSRNHSLHLAIGILAVCFLAEER